jgi:hypothetical protein
MATVRISQKEADEKRLPPLCMLCGAMTEDQVTKEFSWRPRWVGVLTTLYYAGLIACCGLDPLLVLGLDDSIRNWVWGILFGGPAAIVYHSSKKMTVHAPLCAEHLGHWKLTESFSGWVWQYSWAFWAWVALQSCFGVLRSGHGRVNWGNSCGLD